jgi:hypothetical protein
MKIIIGSNDVIPFCIQAIQAFLEFASAQSIYTFNSAAKHSLDRLNDHILVVDNYAQVTLGSIEHCVIFIPVKNFARVRDPSFFDFLTPTLIEQVNAGVFKLIFDFSNEASSAKAIQGFASLVRQKGITNMDMIHWICGNHLLPPKLFGINHHVLNYFEIKAYVDLMDNVGVSQFEQIMTARYFTLDPLPPYILCLNATPRNTRVAAMLSLFKEGVLMTSDYKEEIPNMPFLSFGGFDKMKKGGITAEEIKSWLTAHNMDDLIPYLDWLSPKRLVVDNFKNRGNALFNKVDVSVYEHTCLSYVTETSMSSEISRYTEKSLKPLLLGHPVIVAGTMGNIQLLRGLGFSVLDHVIDHSYDQERDVPTRIRMSAKAAKSFLDSTAKTGSIVIEEVIPHLKANIKWGISGYPLGMLRRTTELLQSICY